MINYIYRDLELSVAQLSKAIKAIAQAKANIVATAWLTNAFPESNAGRWTALLRLQFTSMAQVERLHELGYVTEEPPIITGQAMTEKTPQTGNIDEQIL